jgi:aminotransferase
MSDKAPILNPHIKAVERLKDIKPSGIRRFFTLANEMPNTINLSVGEPDFCPPMRSLEAGWRSAKEGKTHYAPTNGIAELREALARKASRDYNLSYDPNSEILVTCGGTEALFLAFFGLVNDSDEVLIPNPGFVVYEPCVRLVGGAPVSIPLLEENDYKISEEDVTSLITNKSRVMVLNYPNNPTGAVLSHGEIAALAKIVVERDLLVISDEVYEKIIYDDAKHHCIAAFPGMRERTLVVGSFSKTYAMTGLRVGYVYGPRELISNLWLVHQYIAACVDRLAQYIALDALEASQSFVKNMVKEFDRRRRMIYKRLNDINGFHCLLPKGAFYAFPNINDFGLTSEKFAEFLASKSHVITVPGSSFGSYGEGYIRVSYSAAFEQLESAMVRIEDAVKSL